MNKLSSMTAITVFLALGFFFRFQVGERAAFFRD